MGSFCAASDVEPYRGEVSVTVPNGAACWIDTLTPWLLDREAREAEAARQREFVLDHRSSDRVLGLWRDALWPVLEGNTA